MRFSYKVRLLLLWKVLGKWLAVIGALVLLLLISAPKSPLQLPFFNDAGFTGIVGAAIGFIAALYSQRQQATAETALSLRDTIYIPLYNDIKKMSEAMAEEETIPPMVAFTGLGTDPLTRLPKTYIWIEIKQDHREMFVWGVLAKALDNHLDLLGKYYELYNKAQTETKHLSGVALRQHIPLKGNIDETLAAGILSRVLTNKTDRSSTLEHDISVWIYNKELNNISERQQNGVYALVKQLSDDYRELDVVIQIFRTSKQIRSVTDDLVISLRLIIQHINRHYGSHGSIF